MQVTVLETQNIVRGSNQTARIVLDNLTKLNLVYKISLNKRKFAYILKDNLE